MASNEKTTTAETEVETARRIKKTNGQAKNAILEFLTA